MALSTMSALQLSAPGQFGLVEVPVPVPAENEVLIRTIATTICTSDLNDIRGNPFNIPLPLVLGHEGAGIVVAMGEAVQGFRVGDRVAAHPVIPCRACRCCVAGLGHLCEAMGHLGFDRNGTFAEYFAIPAWRVRRSPPGLDLAVAALVEPVAVCLEALRRARLKSGETLLILGDGPFGVAMAKLASRERLRAVVLVGQHDFRLAQVPGAITINERSVPDVASAISQAVEGAAGTAGTGDAGVDAAILAVGSAEALSVALEQLRPRGRLVVFAAIHEPVSLDLIRLHIKELEILGACNDEDFLDEALACLADLSFGLAGLVTHRLPFSEWETAFELAAHGKDRALKVALTFGTRAEEVRR